VIRSGLLLLGFFLFCQLARAQVTLPGFGKPIREELELKSCSFDPGADAMKLIDFQEKEVIVDFGLKVKTQHRVKIKIFNERGFKYASISIPYISKIKGTKITDLSAYIHYLDEKGNTISEKVEKNQVFRDKESDAVKKIRFTFPNVRPGCVIEYRYEKTEKNSLYLDPWFFQDMIPTKYSGFALTLPSAIQMQARLMGVDSVYRNDKWDRGEQLSFPTIIRTYGLENVTAFKREAMMSSLADNLKRVEFAIQPSSLEMAGLLMGEEKWKLYAYLLNGLPNFGKQFNLSVPGTAELIDSAKKLSGKEEKVNYLYQEVKKRVKWDESQTFYPGSLEEVWKEGSGSSADINLLILNLLRRSGIPCSPVLVSTRENGKVDESFFSLSQFNGLDVLLQDSSGNFVLDGTQKYQSYKTPPANILNRYVLCVDTANVNWMFISDSRPLLKTLLHVNAELLESGQIKGSATITFFDHSKVQRILDGKKTKEEEREEEKEFIRKDFTELNIDSLEVLDKDDDLLPMRESFVFSHEPSSSGEFLFLDPFFLSNFRKNPFIDSARQTSIDFISRQYMMTSMIINLPPSYEIDFVPKNIKLRMADSSILFLRNIRIMDHSVHFLNVMEVLYPLFETDEYPGLRDFFTRMYAMLAEQIVLKKKK